MTKVYLYDETTYKYIGSRDAHLDVLETEALGTSVYATPKNGTLVAPPECKIGEVAVYNKEDESWYIAESYIGKYRLNTRTGLITLITTDAPLRSYDVIVTREQYVDAKANPDKYKVVNGKFVDISATQEYQNKHNISLYEQKIREAKEKYDIFMNTPVKYRGQSYLPRYIDDFCKLQLRTFPQEIWDVDGIHSVLMSKADFNGLVKFLEDLVNDAYKTKKEAIKKYKSAIAELK